MPRRLLHRTKAPDAGGRRGRRRFDAAAASGGAGDPSAAPLTQAFVRLGPADASVATRLRPRAVAAAGIYLRLADVLVWHRDGCVDVTVTETLADPALDRLDAFIEAAHGAGVSVLYVQRGDGESEAAFLSRVRSRLGGDGHRP